jgi:hypothetical protein
LETERQGRCLTPIGESFFRDAVRFYVARRPKEAVEFLTKSLAFLEIAHKIGEKQKYSYEPFFSEGSRSSALSFVQWLITGELPREIQEDARTQIGLYYARRWKPDRGSATLSTPQLLYTESYAVIREIAGRLSIGMDREGQKKATGLFGHALRIASAEDEAEREIEKRKLRKSISKQLFTWIDRGHYDYLAYSLYALFPRPEGPPYRLIEDVWKYIPEDVVEARLKERIELGLIP